ncbi:Na+/H+ antiporter subunit E [Modestobacter marinus]|uniref:Na+/H+ antiporter subunit E n=1 Tax=Modestobacter marinus TaxID=477641 RepID=UPI00201A7F7B|nr:Na+/H+ antiporter subunit E [Modestobacter marinus]
MSRPVAPARVPTAVGRARRSRPARIAVLCGAYLLRFLRANLTVARVVVTGRPPLAPALVELELRCRTPTEIAAFMGLITLTPGTMALALSPDRAHLTVHGMHAPDLAAFRADLGVLEDQLLDAVRPRRAPDGAD